jgi:hypothetical protein
VRAGYCAFRDTAQGLLDRADRHDLGRGDRAVGHPGDGLRGARQRDEVPATAPRGERGRPAGRQVEDVAAAEGDAGARRARGKRGLGFTGVVPDFGATSGRRRAGVCDRGEACGICHPGGGGAAPGSRFKGSIPDGLKAAVADFTAGSRFKGSIPDGLKGAVGAGFAAGSRFKGSVRDGLNGAVELGVGAPCGGRMAGARSPAARAASSRSRRL